MICEKCEELKNRLKKSAGDVVTIFLNGKEEGRAILVEPKPSWSDSCPFPIQESEEEGGCEQVNVVSKSWVVEFIGDKFNNKFTTCRKVLEFYSCGELTIEDDEDDSDVE